MVKDYGVIHGDQITKIISTEGKNCYPLTYRLELFVQLWGRWLDEAVGYCWNAVEDRLWAHLAKPSDRNIHPELMFLKIDGHSIKVIKINNKVFLCQYCLLSFRLRLKKKKEYCLYKNFNSYRFKNFID